MILPTKRITEDRCLVGIGSDILCLLDEGPKTVSRIWTEFKRLRAENNAPVIKYDWFIMSLDLLFTLDGITMEKGLLQKVTR